jgi:hypothetical protein
MSYQKYKIFLFYGVYFCLLLWVFINLSLCLAKLHTFLTSALDGDEGVKFAAELLCTPEIELGRDLVGTP